MNVGNDLKIAVIDSGIKYYSDFPMNIIDGCGIVRTKEGSYQITDDYEDEIGHGTAVVDALLKNSNPFAQIYCIKIYEKEIEAETGRLIYALDYIYHNIVCDIVLVSSGVTCCDRYDDLLRAVNQLSKSGVYVVSAFDNDGAVSFPAAFETVIGVGVTQNGNDHPRISAYSMLNVVVPMRFYRLKWVNPSKIIIGGSSFAAASVASDIAEILLRFKDANHPRLSMETLCQALAEKLEVPFVDSDGFVPKASWETVVLV